jgi:hypothetical protein
VFFPSIFGLIGVFIIFGGVVWLLVALPAYPQSRKIFVAWSLLLAVCVGLFWMQLVTPSGPSRFSHVPLLAVLAILTLQICVPFGTSFLLWRVQKQRSVPIGNGWLFIVILVCSLTGGAALKTLNQDCIYYPYHHREGEAWCPVSWQARAIDS